MPTPGAGSRARRQHSTEAYYAAGVQGANRPSRPRRELRNRVVNVLSPINKKVETKMEEQKEGVCRR